MSLSRTLRGLRAAVCLLALTLPIWIAAPAEAAGIAKRGEFRTGPAKRVALTNLKPGGPRRVVGAVRQGDDRLKVIVWDVTDSGQLQRRGDHLGGSVREVDILALTESRVVVAARNAQGNLALSVYDISGSGQVQPRGTGSGGTTHEVGLTRLDPDLFTTAVRGDDDRLKVIRWKVDGSGQIRRDGSVGGGVIGPLAAVEAGDLTLAYALGNDELRLRQWLRGGSDGLLLAGSGEGGRIRDVALTGNGLGTWYTATLSPGPISVRTGRHGGGRRIIDGGRLKVISWERVGDIHSNLGRVAEAEVTGTDGIAFDVATAHIDPGTVFATVTTGVGTYRKLRAKDQGKPRLQIRVWNSADSGMTKRAEAVMGGDYRDIDVVSIRNPAGNLQRLVTAVVGGNGTLKLNVWDYQP